MVLLSECAFLSRRERGGEILEEKERSDTLRWQAHNMAATMNEESKNLFATVPLISSWWFEHVDARGLTYFYAICPTFILHDARRTGERKNSAVYSPSSNSLRMKYFTYYSWKERMREKKKRFFITHINILNQFSNEFSILSLRLENNFSL